MNKGFIGQLAVISVYAFALSFLWNSFNPLVLPYIVSGLQPEFKNTFLGLISTAGLVFAIVVQPLAGAISDRSRWRWGRRRPYIAFGSLGDLICLAMVAAAGSYWFLFLAYCLLQTSSNVAHGPYQGFIPDLMPEERKGIASGAKNLVELVALVLGSAIIGQLLGRGLLAASLFVMGAVITVAMILTLVGVHERPGTGQVSEAAVPSLSLKALEAALRRHSVFVWYVVSRFLILAGLAAVRTFAQNYIQDVLKASNPAELTGELMTVLGISVLVVVLPAGVLADRVGRKHLNVASALFGAVGTALILTSQTYQGLVIFGSIVGMSVGVFLSANWALAMDLIPAAEAALFLGLTNLATAGSGAVAGLLGPFIDIANRSAPGRGYTAVFAVAAVFWLVGALILARLPIKR